MPAPLTQTTGRRKRAIARHLVIWSAAASTGQEAYSLAMILAEHFRDALAGKAVLTQQQGQEALLQFRKEMMARQADQARVRRMLGQ